MFSNASQSKPASSLFSNLGIGSTSSQPQTGGLFGNLNTSTSQAQTQPSMFSNLNSNTSQTQSPPSLFSNLGGASAPQAASNPFAGLGSSQQQTASGTGGLFGATTQPPATNLFASQNISAPQPPQSSLFASVAPQQQQNQPAQSEQLLPVGQQSNGPTGTSQPAYFDSLLEGDISRRVRELGGTGGQAKHVRGQDAKT